MAVEIAAPIAIAAFLILTGEASCLEIQWTDEQGIEWTEEVCMSGSLSGSEYEPVRFEGGVVPEPSTWGVMVLGFGVVGSRLRASRTGPKAHGVPAHARGNSMQVGKGEG